MHHEIPDLLVELRSPNAGTRESAARRLGQLRDAAGVDGLVGALSDQSTEVCLAAIDALAKIGAEALPALIDVLHHHDDSSVRYAVTMVLGRMAHPDSVPGLITALEQDSDRDVQAGAALALENTGTSEALAAVMAWRRDNETP